MNHGVKDIRDEEAVLDQICIGRDFCHILFCF